MALEHVLAKKEELTWSIYLDEDDWEDDLSTEAPSGAYVVTTNMSDYRQDNFEPRDWNSTYKVTISKGQIDQDSAFMAVAELMLASGYYGTFVEFFDFDEEDNKFHLIMGS